MVSALELGSATWLVTLLEVEQRVSDAEFGSSEELEEKLTGKEEDGSGSSSQCSGGGAFGKEEAAADVPAEDRETMTRERLPAAGCPPPAVKADVVAYSALSRALNAPFWDSMQTAMSLCPLSLTKFCTMRRDTLYQSLDCDAEAHNHQARPT